VLDPGPQLALDLGDAAGGRPVEHLARAGARADAESLGVTLANQLLDNGAREILTKLYADHE